MTHALDNNMFIITPMTFTTAILNVFLFEWKTCVCIDYCGVCYRNVTYVGG